MDKTQLFEMIRTRLALMGDDLMSDNDLHELVYSVAEENAEYTMTMVPLNEKRVMVYEYKEPLKHVKMNIMADFLDNGATSITIRKDGIFEALEAAVALLSESDAQDLFNWFLEKNEK